LKRYASIKKSYHYTYIHNNLYIFQVTLLTLKFEKIAMIIVYCEKIFKDLKELEVRTFERKGRFIEERNVEIQLGKNGEWKTLLVIKEFQGRPPYYRRWFEIFNISPLLKWNGFGFIFLKSEYEERFYECIAEQLKPNEWLYLEYDYDEETAKALDLGVPVYATRLGYILFSKGFLWIKNWYYPEGFMEGSAKLQAEKQSSEDQKINQMDKICKEIKNWLLNLGSHDMKNKYMLSSIARAKHILQSYCESQRTKNN